MKNRTHALFINFLDSVTKTYKFDYFYKHFLHLNVTNMSLHKGHSMSTYTGEGVCAIEGHSRLWVRVISQRLCWH